MLDTFREPKSPQFSLILPVTRHDYLDTVLHSIGNMRLPVEQMEVLCMVDSDDKTLIGHVANELIGGFHKFNGVRVWFSGKKVFENDTKIRRGRIIDVHNQAKKLVCDSQYVMGLEDDTEAPSDAFERLFDLILQDRAIGYVEGAQRGRWGVHMIGAWRVDDVKNPRKTWTLAYQPDGIEEIDGGGWYCYLTPTSLYKSTKAEELDDFFGPDVSYGLRLRQKGYRCFIDWNVRCNHKTAKGDLWPNKDVGSAVYRKHQRGYWLYDKNESY